MRVLLISPVFPKSYWGMEYAHRLSGRSALLPPLGLLTVAALLPEGWDAQLVDMNVDPLRDEDLLRADVVFLSAMQIQRESYHAVIRRSHALGKPVVVGGPYATTDPESSADADAVVVGEAEDLVESLCADLSSGRLERRYEASERPDVSRSPVPRFDLLSPGAYACFGVQFSRGCPFNCEFCDIIEIYGRVPRTKSPTQLLEELDAVYATGFRGSVFLVDDNFIGNKGAAKALVPQLASWMARRGRPFELFTEASVNLAREDALLAGMVRAGFSAVFLGIETPSAEALAATQKRQNLGLDLREAVEKITRAGLEVMAGFIVGFDSDREDVFARQQAFIAGSPIPLAMVGILNALPGTQLWRRLEREGRLRAVPAGDNFGRTNFETRLPEAALVDGYGRLLAALYDPRSYFARCERTLELLQWTPKVGYGLGFVIKTLLRSLYWQGARSNYRRAYWSFLGKVLWRRPRHLVRAVAMAVKGEHLIRYTHEHVLPALRRSPARRVLEPLESGARPRPLKIAARVEPSLRRSGTGTC